MRFGNSMQNDRRTLVRLFRNQSIWFILPIPSHFINSGSVLPDLAALIWHWIAVPISWGAKMARSRSWFAASTKTHYPDEKRRTTAPRVTRTCPPADFATGLQKEKAAVSLKTIRDWKLVLTAEKCGPSHVQRVSIFISQSCLLLRSAALIESRFAPAAIGVSTGINPKCIFRDLIFRRRRINDDDGRACL